MLDGMKTLAVTISDEAAAKLTELARHDLRSPRREAAALLAKTIERASRANTLRDRVPPIRPEVRQQR